MSDKEEDKNSLSDKCKYENMKEVAIDTGTESTISKCNEGIKLIMNR